MDEIKLLSCGHILYTHNIHNVIIDVIYTEYSRYTIRSTRYISANKGHRTTFVLLVISPLPVTFSIFGIDSTPSHKPKICMCAVVE